MPAVQRGPTDAGCSASWRCSAALAATVGLERSRPGSSALACGRSPRAGSSALAGAATAARPGRPGDPGPGGARRRGRRAGRSTRSRGRRRCRCSVTLAAVALALDASTAGWPAAPARSRRSARGFDMEVDAFLILVLSVYVAASVGPWVLAHRRRSLPAASLAGRVLPWLRAADAAAVLAQGRRRRRQGDRADRRRGRRAAARRSRPRCSRWRWRCSPSRSAGRSGGCGGIASRSAEHPSRC